MDSRNHLTVQDKLVIAAYYLQRDGRSPFTAEDLVVAAWRQYPDTFGLAGYKSSEGRLMYPDSNRVFAEIMGSKPVRKRGLLTKVGEKMYKLTEAGTQHAMLLIHGTKSDAAQKAGLARDARYYFERLLESRATCKYREGRPDDITFFDACAFYGISARSSAIELQGQAANLLGVLEAAKAAAADDSVTLRHDGKAYGAKEIEGLFTIHEFLQEKFRAELDIIRKRIDERK